MVPVIIGAAAVGLAGVALLSGDDKNQPDTEKRQVSEDYVMRQLNRAKKDLHKVDIAANKNLRQNSSARSLKADIAEDIEQMLSYC